MFTKHENESSIMHYALMYFNMNVLKYNVEIYHVLCGAICFYFYKCIYIRFTDVSIDILYLQMLKSILLLLFLINYS